MYNFLVVYKTWSLNMAETFRITFIIKFLQYFGNNIYIYMCV